MALNWASTVVFVFIAVVVIYISSVYLFSPEYDAREPPVIPHMIPYIGHILGLIRYGGHYFSILSAENKSFPIFTLQTASKRTYIVASADLVTACERNQKTLSFFPFISAITPRIFGIPAKGGAMEIVRRNIDGKDGNWGLVNETSKGMHSEMAPGSNLDHMNRSMLSIMATYFDELASEGGIDVDLFAWIRPRFTIASTQAIYGPGNPFKVESGLESAFWDFDQDLTMMILGVAPRILARKGYAGRRRIQQAMIRYFGRGDHKNGLGVIRVRHDVARKYGATTSEIALFEIGDLLGVLINAQPTFFWTLLHIYSDSALLGDIRDEISASGALKIQISKDGRRRHTIDITTLEETCPLIVSAYREVLRLRTLSSSHRWVMEDTLLNNQYLLKKDSVLLIPGALIHADPVWGANAKEYNPRRFLKKDTNTKPGVYRAWGGGQTLCPGRFFATTEIASAVAMVVLRFDMEPADGKGWKMPKTDTTRVASSICPPKEDVKVRITEREGCKGDQWGFAFAELLN